MKFNRGFVSIRFFFKRKNPQKLPHYNPEGQSQLLGSLQPFGDLINDVRTFSKPYKSSGHFWLDLFQPIKALALVAAGLFYIVAAPTIGVSLAIGRALNKTEKRPTGDQLWSWAGLGVSSIVAGAVSLAMIPFTLVKILTKAIITFCQPPNAVPYEAKTSNQRLVAKTETDPSSIQLICRELHRKYKESSLSTDTKGYETNVYRRAKRKYNENEDSYKEYLVLFTNRARFPSTQIHERTPIKFSGPAVYRGQRWYMAEPAAGSKHYRDYQQTISF